MAKDNPKLRKNGGEGTKIGKFLRSIDKEDILNATSVVTNFATGNILGGLNSIKALVSEDSNITPENKLLALKELDLDISEAEQVTKRWESDMVSDSWLSKNVRPLVLIFLIFNTMLLIFIDAGFINFKVEDNWVGLLEVLLLTVIAAYFGGRTWEKTRKK